MSLDAMIATVLDPHRYASQPAIDAMNSVPLLAPVAVGAYVVFVFGGQAVMKDREAFNLKTLNTIWNFILATFSILGAIVTVPSLFAKFMGQSPIVAAGSSADAALLAAENAGGLSATACTPWFYEGELGFWLALFVWSKIFEFIDTVFLVLQKKPVIFLHWYHHVTVMLYCWDTMTSRIPAALWYCAMNYFVHAIMYSYYFLMTRKAARPMVKPFAPLITFLQIAQMVVGFAVAAYSMAVIRPMAKCDYYPTNTIMCLVMYGSYFLLFSQLFYKNYIKGNKHKSSNAAAASTSDVTMRKSQKQ